MLDNHRNAAFTLLGKECEMVSAVMPPTQGGYVHIQIAEVKPLELQNKTEEEIKILPIEVNKELALNKGLSTINPRTSL